MYGKHWLDMWANIPMEDVKDQWGAAISAFRLDEVGRAIEHCANPRNGLKFPPTLPEFVSICQAMKIPEVTHALPRPPVSEESLQQQREIKQVINQVLKPQRDYKQWARDILANPQGLPDISIRFAREALGIDQHQEHAPL